MEQRVEQQRHDPGLDVVVVKLDHLTEKVDEVKTVVESMNGRVAANTKLLANHHSRLSVIEAAWQYQIRPALDRVVDNRVEIAKVLAKIAAGGFGGMTGLGVIAYVIGKSAGWW